VLVELGILVRLDARTSWLRRFLHNSVVDSSIVAHRVCPVLVYIILDGLDRVLNVSRQVEKQMVAGRGSLESCLHRAVDRTSSRLLGLARKVSSGTMQQGMPPEAPPSAILSSCH